jgi:anti-sigma factor RsiW
MTVVCQDFVGLVTAYLEGALSPEERAAVDAHLAGCPHCTAYLEQMRATIAATGRLRDSDVSAESVPPDVLDALTAAFRARPPAT